MNSEWKIHINGEWHGPYQAREIATWLREGKYGDDAFVFAKGMQQPKMIREVPEIKTALDQPAHEQAEGPAGQPAGARPGARPLPQELWRSPVLVQVILYIVTLGIWAPVWFLVQKKGINNLASADQLGSVGAVLILICSGIGLLFNFGLPNMPSAGGAGGGDPAIAQILTMVSLVWFCSLFSFGMLTALTYKVRGMLVEHQGRPIAHVWPFIFGMLYLQYAINRMVDEQRQL